MVLENMTLPVSLVVSLALPIGLVIILLGCMQCLRKKIGGFSNFTGNNSNSVNNSQAHVNATFSLDMDDTDVDSSASTSVTIDPLPDISGKAKLPSVPLRPRMGCVEKSRQNSSIKMIAGHHAFPRSQIMYLKELGVGWFGKVIVSDAEKIITGVPRSRVVVKMLKDDASKDEQLLYFEDVAPYREIEHKNIIKLLGQCTEMHPMLMILEFGAFGNLKHYLRTHQHQVSALIQKNRLMQFSLDAACGLACLHRHDYIHRDLSARNCIVMSDHTLKIGDYGIAEELYKDDYMTSGNELLPIRWMAPETLKQELGKWTAHSFSKESDIWSLGVLLWEIASLGERPYDMLTDEAVLQGVILDQDIRLPEPHTNLPNMDRLYEVMLFCWLEAPQRTKVDEVYGLLQKIASHAAAAASSTASSAMPGDAMAAFEQKWEHLMPNMRRLSTDSTADQLDKGSESSGESELLEDLNRIDSLEDLTAPPPLAPPKRVRKKVAVSFSVTAPDADEDALETPVEKKPSAAPIAAKPSVPEQKFETAAAKPSPMATLSPDSTPGEGRPVPARKAPPIPQTADTKQVVAAGQAPEPAKKFPEKVLEVKKKNVTETAEPTVPRTAPENDFTDFTSHETADNSVLGADLFESPDVYAVNKDSADVDLSAGNAHTKVAGGLEEVDSFVMVTPVKPLPKPRKTSTTMAKNESSPSPSSSAVSPNESSSDPYLTAQSSSGLFADARATASDSTLVTGKTDASNLSSFDTFGEQPNGSDSGSMSFVVLESTAIPPVFNSFDKSQSISPSNPFKVASAPSQNPLADAATADKDDSFGEFTDASQTDEYTFLQNAKLESSHEETSVSSRPALPSAQYDIFGFMSEPSKIETKGSDKGNIETGNDASPFFKFGTDLSSLSPMTVPAPVDHNQQEAFSSFESQLSSISSLDTNTADTESPSIEHSKLPEHSLDLEFSFDLLTTMPDVANKEFSAIKQPSADNEGALQTPNFLGDFKPSTPPTTNASGSSTREVSPDSGNQSSGTQHSAADDIFGFGEPAKQRPATFSPDSSFEVLDANNSGSSDKSNNPFADFDLLTGLTAGPSAVSNTQGSSSNPFSTEGSLLSDFGGASLSAAPLSAEKVGTVSNGVEGSGANFSMETETFSSGSTDNTDSSSTTNSDSSKDYICEEPWGEGAEGCVVAVSTPSPPPASPTSSEDSEELALQIASEIYLSRGLKMPRNYETPTILETIHEDPLPPVSEESAAPTPSETSSVDVRFEDVFEWDDFMGESLMGKERTSIESESPKEYFDMTDWTLDGDSESMRSNSSFHSQQSEEVGKGSKRPDSLSVGSTDTPNVHTSFSDNEVTSHIQAKTMHRSFIADLIANKTKGMSLNTSTSSAHSARTTVKQNQFYSLYEEDFDFESDSQSEGSCSPPVSNPAFDSESQRSEEALPLHDLSTPLTSFSDEMRELSAATNTQDSQDETVLPNGSGTPEKSQDSSLLDFTDFESASTTASADERATKTEAKSAAEDNAPSLLDF